MKMEEMQWESTCRHAQERSKWSAHKRQPLPVYSPSIGEDLGDLDRTLDSPVKAVETSMSVVMDLLLDISSQLQVKEHVDGRSQVRQSRRGGLETGMPILQPTCSLDE